ncbi:2-C-methyl-D-erythritol 2,4-cyclodiphosphate synthase [bacterium]|nr:2-C-methyl-D-erythritol 2,4-cyclodiphosphate synthase [bacterium]
MVTPFRIGIGFDAHRLVENRPLILGGVTIDYHRGLLGHSDADVLTHVIIDALIGAADLGSIGLLFPDSDPQYKGVASTTLLQQVVAKVRSKGFEIGNVDSVIVAQAPKLMPFRDEMKKNLAAIMAISTTDISIKATTTETLGFEGQGDGISAHAVALIVAHEHRQNR